MKLLFKQRVFSWLDSYDIYDEDQQVVYTVKGQLSWGHKLVIMDLDDHEIGMVKEEVMTWLPRFMMSVDGQEIGEIKKELTLWKPKFTLECFDWHVEGSMMEWDYTIYDANQNVIATLSKEVFHWADTYVMDIVDDKNALYVLMITLAIDAAKCSSNNG